VGYSVFRLSHLRGRLDSLNLLNFRPEELLALRPDPTRVRFSERNYEELVSLVRGSKIGYDEGSSTSSLISAMVRHALDHRVWGYFAFSQARVIAAVGEMIRTCGSREGVPSRKMICKEPEF